LVDQFGLAEQGPNQWRSPFRLFTPVEDSLFLTLYSRALDNRLSKPILSDATADEIVRNLDYDFEQFKVNKNFILNVALRAKKLDEVASGFIRHHPDAVGA
jgi:O-methyltransferase involved in polyketide biosynthesis